MLYFSFYLPTQLDFALKHVLPKEKCITSNYTLYMITLTLHEAITAGTVKRSDVILHNSRHVTSKKREQFICVINCEYGCSASGYSW